MQSVGTTADLTGIGPGLWRRPVTLGFLFGLLWLRLASIIIFTPFWDKD